MTKRADRITAHQQANKDRAADIDAIRASYQKIKDTPGFKDILTKAGELIKYHEKIAKDGVGYKTVMDENGIPRQELIYFTPEKRLGELDRAAGLEELIVYVERQLVLRVATPSEKGHPKS